MKIQVCIPTLKWIDHSAGCVYPNVKSILVRGERANDEIKRASYRNDSFGYYINVKIIAEDDFCGDRLSWLKEHSIYQRGRYEYILSNKDGGTFLTMIKEGGIGIDNSLRRKAIKFVEDMDAEDLEDFIVRSHTDHTHQWVQCFPDGSVSETEEADDYTTHWIDYPNKAVASIYEISGAGGVACNCDVCTMFKHFDDMEREDFIERYSEDDWDYCNETSIDDAILDFERDNDGLNSGDIREEMITAIEEIPQGYFDDEETNIDHNKQ